MAEQHGHAATSHSSSASSSKGHKEGKVRAVTDGLTEAIIGPVIEKSREAIESISEFAPGVRGGGKSHR